MVRAQARRAVWTERPGWVAKPKPHNIRPVALGQLAHPPHRRGYPGSQAAGGMEFGICKHLQVAQWLWVAAACTRLDSCCS